MAKKKSDLLKELLNEVKKLGKAEKYKEVVDLLSDEVLDQYKQPFLYMCRAYSYNELKEFGMALEDYSQAIELKPDYHEAYCNRGNTYRSIKEYQKGIADCNKAIELKPGYPSAYNNRGNCYDDLKEYDKAIVDYTKAIESDVNYALAYMNRGGTYWRQREYDKAIVDCSKAIELEPAFAEAFNVRGNCYDEIGEYDKAISDYNNAIELNPNYVIALVNRAIVYKHNGNLNDAFNDCKRAIEIDPDYASAYTNLGMIHYTKQEYEQAVYNLNVALEKQDQWKWVKYWRDKAVEALERRKEIAGLKEPDSVSEVRDSIEESVASIRKLSVFEEEFVVHYTALHTAQAILSAEKSKMRFYNAIYMNDPEEGEVLFAFFGDDRIKECFENGKRVNETSVYLGSFLPAPLHEDELIMWRTYGKDGTKMEAGGCSLIFDTSFFHKDGEVNSKGKIDASEPEQVLMKVAYFKNGEFHKDTPEGIQDALVNIKLSLLELIKLRDNDVESNKEIYDRIIFRVLSVIAYLFKSSDYAFESEVRVVQYMPLGSDLIQRSPNKDVAGEPPSKMYVESVREILPYLKKVYLGAKVPNPSHWSAYFDYEIRQKAKVHPQKDKIKVEIAKSICKFQ